jgi:tRNA pseudouridine synthase 10
LVGCSPEAEIINREDKLKSEFNLTYSESFKSHFNREVGKILENLIGKTVEFKNPDLVFVFNLGFDSFNINLQINSIFIYGRYKKFQRGIPQTHWFCRDCRGRGCEKCNGTGKMYPTSVEEKISELFIKYSKATNSKFHGAGREDIDARMLGNGRSFILQLNNPKIRHLDLKKLEKKTNKVNKKKVEIHELRFSTRKEMVKLKSNAAFSNKTYDVLVEFEKDIDEKSFQLKLKELKEKLENNLLLQETPLRVMHRRANITRKKKVFDINGKLADSKHARFSIKTIGGTYIKELINGDSGRTRPSFSEIFGFQCICKELDVINIEL